MHTVIIRFTFLETKLLYVPDLTVELTETLPRRVNVCNGQLLQ